MAGGKAPGTAERLPDIGLNTHSSRSSLAETTSVEGIKLFLHNSELR